jgi:hypothetical protein
LALRYAGGALLKRPSEMIFIEYLRKELKKKSFDDAYQASTTTTLLPYIKFFQPYPMPTINISASRFPYLEETTYELW